MADISKGIKALVSHGLATGDTLGGILKRDLTIGDLCGVLLLYH